jgi:hypothetical protein
MSLRPGPPCPAPSLLVQMTEITAARVVLYLFTLPVYTFVIFAGLRRLPPTCQSFADKNHYEGAGRRACV